MQDQSLLERITLDPNVMVGKPVIRGTRLTVEYILNLLANGASIVEILEEYEGLTSEDIRACMLFASKTFEAGETIKPFDSSESTRYSEAMAEIRQRQKERNHQPPSPAEVEEYLRQERDSWDNTCPVYLVSSSVKIYSSVSSLRPLAKPLSSPVIVKPHFCNTRIEAILSLAARA